MPLEMDSSRIEDVCCIVQFQGFDCSSRGYPIGICPDKDFILKEVAFVPISPTESYSPSSAFFDLHNFHSSSLGFDVLQNIEQQTRDLHGLLFWSTKEEEKKMSIFEYHYRLELLVGIQAKTARGPNKKQNVVAYYDGCMHEDVYLKCHFIPNVCLQDCGVPSYKELFKEKSYSHITCGFHNHGTDLVVPCPKAQIAAYRDWWMSKFQQ